MGRLLTVLAILSTQILFSQNYIHQVLILNEGYFDYSLNQSIQPVTIGTYNPSIQTYLTVDTIQGARFASDLVISGDYFYVAADNMLHKYDKNTYELITSQQVDGVRNLAVWNDKILVTRGNYDNVTFSPIFYNSYLQVYNTSDLSLYLELDTTIGPKWATQNIIIDEAHAYVAVNNAYEWGNEKGLIGVIDLHTFTYLNEIDLGPDGINPDNIMRYGDDLYTINNKDWSGSSVSLISLTTHNSTTINLGAASSGCGTSCMRDNKINYQISGDNLLYQWDIALLPATGSLLSINQNFYNLSYDPINDLLYSSVTDYTTFGNINIYNENDLLINTFPCGVSPGTIVFDIRNMTSVNYLNYTSSHKDDILYDLQGRNIDNNPTFLQGLYIKNNTLFFQD